MDETSGDQFIGGGSVVQAPRSLSLFAVAILVVTLVWSYWSNLGYLMNYWGDSNYSHGWLIIPISLAILWQRRDSLAMSNTSPNLWGLIPLASLLVARYWLYERNEQWIEAASIPLVIAAMVFAVGGWALFRWSLPAILFLFFMVPLPPSLNTLLAGPLQTLATIGAVSLIQASGIPVISEGNVILIGTQRLEVAEACRGLSMLLSFVALITAMVILVKRPLWERVVLMLSTIPIALLCNIVRIAVTAIFYAKTGRPVQVVHDWAGMAMMVLALILVVAELKVMSWLVVEEHEATLPNLLRASYGSYPDPR